MATPAPSSGPPPAPRGPLSHIVDAIRLDNTNLLLESLSRDPRFPPPSDDGDGADHAAGGGTGAGELPPRVARTDLVFGSSDLRRVVTRHVMRPPSSPSGAAKPTGKDHGKKNVTEREEDDSILRGFNEMLGGRAEVVGTDVLSSAGDGSTLGPGGRKQAAAAAGRSAMFAGANPFDSSEDLSSRDSGEPSNVTTYVLRGGGFDLPSLSSAAAHRRRAAAAAVAKRGGGRLFRFLFAPRLTELERAYLSELGVEHDCVEGASVRGNVNSFEDLGVDLVPLDDDVWSLELGGGVCPTPSRSPGDGVDDRSGPAAAMRRADVEGCRSDVADAVARSLLKVQLLDGGPVGRVQGIGPMAAAVIDRMMTLRVEEERIEEEAREEERQQADECDDGSDEPHLAEESATQMEEDGETSKIKAMIVIDRRVDLVTPMLTPLTYEGLVDDVLGIRTGGCVAVKRSLVDHPDDDEDGGGRQQRHTPSRPSEDPTVLLPLNDTDPLYSEVRNMHVESFGSFLGNQAKALRESHSQFTSRDNARSRDLAEIHQFVKQIPAFARNLRSLRNHIHVAERVKGTAESGPFRQRWMTERGMLEGESCYDALEDLLAADEDPYRFFRLMCLQSLTGNGIKSSKYDSLRREAVQAYGYEYLSVLHDLERAGLLRRRETFSLDSMATPYSTLRKALNLIDADVDPSDPKDVSYVSSGYAPMTVRWVERAMDGYAGTEDAMMELPTGSGGRWVDIEQRRDGAETLAESLARGKGGTLRSLAGSGKGDDGRPVLLVYYVGGVTFMELAALRFLSRGGTGFPYRIVCCATEVVNGSTLLRSLSC